MKTLNGGDAASRRAIVIGLGLGGLALAGAASALSVSWTAKSSTKSNGWWDATFPALKHGGMEEWAALAGEWFYFLGGPTGFASYMVREVKPMLSAGERPAGVGRKQAFAVTFQTWSLKRAVPGDATLEMTHPSYPALPIYVGPALLFGDKSLITAVFN